MLDGGYAERLASGRIAQARLGMSNQFETAYDTGEFLLSHKFGQGLMKPQNSLSTSAQQFASLGSDNRLEVLMALVKAGQNGLSIGEIQKKLDIPASTLAHHLGFLTSSGLVLREKIGRTGMVRPDFEAIQALADYLLMECCADQDGPAPKQPSASS